MTEQEIEMIRSVGDALRAAPVSWDEIDDQTKQIITETMRPCPTFTGEQRSFLNLWWLKVDEEQLRSINEELPTGNVCEARIDGNGDMWLSADLFTDAVDEGARLNNVLPMLLSLQLHYHETDFWPQESIEP